MAFRGVLIQHIGDAGTFIRTILSHLFIVNVLSWAVSVTSVYREFHCLRLLNWIFQILLQLEKHEIQIYSFPVSELDTQHHWMRERMPFAVVSSEGWQQFRWKVLLYLANLKVGSNITITDPDSGLRYRGREYPWGCVNIEDKVRYASHMDRMILEGYYY